MATPSLDLAQQSRIIPPQVQASQEHTIDAPMIGTSEEPQNSGGISAEDQQTLIALARRYKASWAQDRILLVTRILENLEMFKGNQNVVFGPGTTAFTTPQSWMDSQHSKDSDDDALFQDCLNFYQMLAIGFVASLCPQLPKPKWMPEDAEQPTDVATAKAAQILIDKVRRDNKAMSMLRTQLLLLYCTGAVYRFTRFVVSATLAGTKKEPVFDQTQTEIMPARMHCFNCGADNSAGTPQCANCKQSMGEDSFFPPVVGPVTRQVGTQDVPNGIVHQSLFSGLEVDTDPTADNIRQTPIINLEYEVHIGALRFAYPAMFDQIQSSASSELSENASLDRLARQQVYLQIQGESSYLADQRPTLSQTWFQPWAFALEDDQGFVQRMTEAFPTGCLLINTGSVFLSVQEMDMNKHWTHCKTHPEKFGMNPPAPGDVVVPFQRRYNDMGNILHDGVARTFAGLIVSNNDLIDSRAFQGKKLQFGVFNPVKLKRTGAPGSQRLEDAFHQFEFAVKIQEAMEYQKFLALSAQQFALVPPQVYGGAGDPNIQTAAGQEQNLNTARGALNIYWENIKDEHAQADEQAVVCAKENLTSDLRMVIEEKGAEFRNQYVRLDDLQGSIHAYADEDQGLPVSAEELRNRWTQLWQAADKNPAVQALLDDPENQEQAIASLGAPGMVVPKSKMRDKVLAVIAKLVAAQGIPQTDPQTGQPTGQLQPSVMPDKDIDDFDVLKQVVKDYCYENYDLPETNQPGWQNILAYYRAAVAMETAQLVQQAQQQGTALGAGKMAAAPPPKPPPQLSPQDQSMLNMVRQDGAEAMSDLLNIAKQPALPKGSSLQAQVAAANDLLQLAAKVEQIAADKTTVQ